MIHGLLDYCDRFAEWILDESLDLVRSPFNASSRLYWVFLLSALVLAAITYKRYYHHDGALRFAEFIKFVLPKRIYAHPSAIVDYKLFISNHFIGPVTFGPFAEGFSAALVASYVVALLASGFAATWQGFPIGGGVILAFTIVYGLVSDFVTYINHRLHHQVDLLWPIHRVHHSAEVLTPFTLFRKHPLYNIVKLFISAPVLGVFQGITLFLFLGEIEALTILGINAVSALFRIFGANLRHSHIWFSFGHVLNHIFISPAHHQIHHSARPEHWNRNYGEVFAIWDWMFATLVLPSEEIRKDLILGIGIGAPQHHPTLAKAYLEPLASMYEILTRRFRYTRLAP